MQRKQQVGECWVCVIFFACVCVWVRYDNCVWQSVQSSGSAVCAGRFPRGVPGGGRYAPPWLRGAFGTRGRRGSGQRSAPGVARGNAPKFFFWAVICYF
jgi:hypothetical protein